MMSEINFSHEREHSRTKICLRQKVPQEEYNQPAVRQCGHVWGQSLCPQLRPLPKPEYWCWKINQMDGNQNEQQCSLKQHAPHAGHAFVLTAEAAQTSTVT